MIQFDLTTSDSLMETLLVSAGSGVREFINSRPKSECQRLRQQMLTLDAMKRLQPPGRCYLRLVFCAPDESLPLMTWWDVCLFWNTHGSELDPPGTQLFSKGAYKVDIDVNPIKQQIESSIDTRPPPYELFVPLPKTEIGGCARSDSSLRPQ
jgi:hypothetical protein